MSDEYEYDIDDAIAAVQECKDRCAVLTGQRDRARALLRRLQWSALDDFDELFCTICERSKADGHDKACELAAVLAEVDVS